MRKKLLVPSMPLTLAARLLGITYDRAKRMALEGTLLTARTPRGLMVANAQVHALCAQQEQDSFDIEFERDPELAREQSPYLEGD